MKNDKFQIYVASPYGFSEAGRFFMYDKLFPEIYNLGYDILDPWNLNNDTKKLFDVSMKTPYGTRRRHALRVFNKKVGEDNELNIKNADGLIAVLDGVDVDSGTSSEIGYAYALNKPIIGYKGDFRLTSDNDGSIVNLQVEYFINKSGGRIVTRLEDLGDSMKEVFRK